MKLESPMTVTYEPIGSRVLLSCPAEDVNGMVNQGGVLVPEAESRRKKPIIEMTVLAAGPKCGQLKTGDIVLFNHGNSGAETREGIEYRWTEEQFIIAIVRRKLVDLSTPITPVD
jgi:co-chaperonin GroES (HSP10)